MAGNKISIRELVPFLAIILVLGLLLTYGENAKQASSQGTVSTIARACQSEGNKETCYAKEFEKLTAETDRDSAFTVLRDLQKVEPESRGCHFIAHAISTTETRKDPSKWKELMNTAPPDCSYGAAHGALEVYASTFPDGEIPKEEVPNICNNPDTSNCSHGLGHLLLVLNKNDIDESVKNCQSLPQNFNGKFECLTGVFMERITALNLEIHGLATKEALNWAARVPELEGLCREQSGESSVACWKEIAHAILIKFRNDPQETVSFCESSYGEDETRQCIDHSLGIIAAGYNFQLSIMTPICEAKAKDSDFKNRCYSHLVAATLSTIPSEIPAAVNFCGRLSANFQESCFTMIGNSLQRTNPENKILLARECAKAPEELVTRCESGGNSNIRFYGGD